MTSADNVVIEIAGREYEVIAGRLSAIEKDNREIRAEMGVMNNKLDLVLVRMDAMNTRIEDMKFYMSLTFGAIAVFVAAVALTPIVSKIIQVLRKPDNDEKIRMIAREELARMNNGA